MWDMLSTAQVFPGAFGVPGGAIVPVKTLLNGVFQQRDILFTLVQSHI